MKLFRLILMVALFGCLAWRPGAAAAGADAADQEVHLIGAELSYYCFLKGKSGQQEVSGLACEILKEMARRVGHSGKVQMYPLARALMLASTSPAVFMVPLGRIPSREKQYLWQVQIFEDDFLLVTSAASSVDISTVDAAKSLTIGVVRDGAGARLAEDKGLARLKLVAHDDTNARKLKARRIDAWLSSWNGIRAAQRDVGLKEEELRRGAVLSRVKVYLASSLDMDPLVAARWKAAFDDMVRDGSYEALLRKYRFDLPK